MLIAVPIDRLTFNQLHDQIRLAVGWLVGRSAVKQPGDIGVSKIGQRLPLAAKAVKDVVGGYPASDHLKGDVAVERPVGPDRAVHRAHPARGDHVDQPIRPNPLADA